MKKQILKTISIVGLFFNSNLLAVTDNEVNTINKLINSIPNSNLKISSLNFKTKNFDITTDFIKYNFTNSYQDEDGHYIDASFSLDGYIFFGNKNIILNSTSANSQEYHNLTQIVCDKEDYINLILLEENFSHFLRSFYIFYHTSIYKISKNNTKYYIEYLDKETNNIFSSPLDSINLDLSYPEERYPYYNKEKIINRLIETEFCKKDEIVEGIAVNIENSLKIFPLDNLIEKIKNKDMEIDTYYIVNFFVKYPLENKTLQKYNDIAYYLQQSNANDEAIFLLEKIIEKFPNRTVAYLNLADSYAGKGESEKAKQNYEKYISLMKQDGKESKIPQRVLEFK